MEQHLLFLFWMRLESDTLVVVFKTFWNIKMSRNLNISLGTESKSVLSVGDGKYTKVQGM